MNRNQTAAVRILALCLAAAGLVSPSAAAEPRPIRVLFLGHESEHHSSGKYLPYLMGALGREAIYFDSFTRPDCLNPATLAGYDAVVVVTDHDAVDYRLLGEHARLIVDTRNAMHRAGIVSDKVVKA